MCSSACAAEIFTFLSLTLYTKNLSLTLNRMWFYMFEKILGGSVQWLCWNVEWLHLNAILSLLIVAVRFEQSSHSCCHLWSRFCVCTHEISSLRRSLINKWWAICLAPGGGMRMWDDVYFFLFLFFLKISTLQQVRTKNYSPLSIRISQKSRSTIKQYTN